MTDIASALLQSMREQRDFAYRELGKMTDRFWRAENRLFYSIFLNVVLAVCLVVAVLT
jgi:hypothetical protein